MAGGRTDQNPDRSNKRERMRNERRGGYEEQKGMMEGGEGKGRPKEGKGKGKGEQRRQIVRMDGITASHGWIGCGAFVFVFFFVGDVIDTSAPLYFCSNLKLDHGSWGQRACANQGGRKYWAGPRCRCPCFIYWPFVFYNSRTCGSHFSLSLLGPWCISLFAMVVLLCSIEWCWNVLCLL